MTTYPLRIASYQQLSTDLSTHLSTEIGESCGEKWAIIPSSISVDIDVVPYQISFYSIQAHLFGGALYTANE
jgi:hypothetical protein